jgi:single-stranded-DNA-specific exonuclease
MKKWEILNELRIKNDEFRIDDVIKILLENRGLKSKKEIEEFLNPTLESLTDENLGIDIEALAKAVNRIKAAIKNNEQIIIYGDYDVDGITGTAVLWEVLNDLRANVMPYIPHREDEGYGLSIKGIDNLLIKYPQTKLIITVDNGIVASKAVEYAKSLELDVIITDHHVTDEKTPDAFSIVHSTKICGSAVAWYLGTILEESSNKRHLSRHLELVALATVADVMQLIGFNRNLLMFGLKKLRKTERPGLIELYKLAGLTPENIGVYEIGHVIGPRINAMGRIESAMDSLRFLCTPNRSRAKELAEKLHLTNLERQKFTSDGVLKAKNLIGKKADKLIFLSDESYKPGVIGLISGKLTEEFYKPSIVVSIGEEFSKGSARSVSGFNIIEFIRKASDLLVDAGGHPMAAGFTVRTEKLPDLITFLKNLAEKEVDDKLLFRKLKIDCELPIELISKNLFDEIYKLSPFGYGNSEPVFLDKEVTIEDLRFVGADKKHLKIKCTRGECKMDAILFNYLEDQRVNIGDKVNIAYSISLNEWNGNEKLELKIKDIQISL